MADGRPAKSSFAPRKTAKHKAPITREKKRTFRGAKSDILSITEPAELFNETSRSWAAADEVKNVAIRRRFEQWRSSAGLPAVRLPLALPFNQTKPFPTVNVLVRSDRQKLVHIRQPIHIKMRHGIRPSVYICRITNVGLFTLSGQIPSA